ncbi:MAG: hypothetical protein ACRDS0_13100 [Pseudonocardiaceae bacterium]
MLRVNSIRWSRKILGALQDNGKVIVDADQLWDVIMGGIATLFIAVVLLVGVVVMWAGILFLGYFVFRVYAGLSILGAYAAHGLPGPYSEGSTVRSRTATPTDPGTQGYKAEPICAEEVMAPPCLRCSSCQ